jgi:hypothetical protein
MDYQNIIKINNKIKALQNKDEYISIYKIVSNDENINFTSTDKGLYFNLNNLNVITLTKLEKYLNIRCFKVSI